MTKIAPNLEGLALDIDAVSLHPRNPRQGDVGAVSQSLERFGQTKPIVVQASTMYVVAGNHLLQAARSLGWTKIAVNVMDLDDREATAYLLADNRTSDLGSYNDDVLKAILVEEARAGNLGGTGYDGDDVDVLLLHPEKQAGEPGESSFLGWLVFGEYKVIMSSAELQAVVARWRAYLEREGTDIGFVMSLLEA